MRQIFCIFSLAFISLFSYKVSYSQNIYTFAGVFGATGYSGDGGCAAVAHINGPTGIAVDTIGNVYFCDTRNSVVRKITPSGRISTIAGNGTVAYAGDGAAATMASLSRPSGVAVDKMGNILISDNGNNVIRKVDTAGIITTIAGNNTAGFSGDGGAATLAQMRGPNGIAADTSGNIYFCDTRNNVVRKVNSSGIIQTVAGNNTAGYSGDGGAATLAQLSRPLGLSISVTGNLFIADSRNNVVRMVNTSGNISTFAGNAVMGYSGDGGPATLANLYKPNGIGVDAMGNVFISDSSNTVRKVGINDTITTFAGSDVMGYSGDGAAATLAKMTTPSGIAIDRNHNVYIATPGNNVIRRVGLPVSGISIIANTGDTICFGNWLHFTASVIADSVPHFQWKINGVNVGTDSSGYTPATTLVTGDTISCQLLDSAGGTAIATSNNLRLDSLPATGTIAGPPSLCMGNFVNLVHLGTPGGMWVNGNPIVASFTPPSRITAMSTGVDTVYYIQTNMCGTDSAKFVVNVIANNIGHISGPTKICTGSIVTYTDTTVGGKWRARPFFAGTIDSLTGVFTANFLPGTSYVTYGLPGCTVTDTISVINLGAIVGPTSMCMNNGYYFADTSIGGKWSATPGELGSIDSLTGIFTAGNAGGMVTVTYGVSSACFVTDSLPVVQVGPILGPELVCNGSAVTYNDTTAGGTWGSIPSTSGYITGGGVFMADTIPGNAVIFYTSPTGCTVNDTLTIDLLPTIAPIIGPWKIDSTWSITLTDSTTGGVWSSSDTTIAKVDSFGNVTGISSGIATITYSFSNTAGCVGFVFKNVAVLNEAGVKSILDNRDVNIYPNPAQNETIVSWVNQPQGNGKLLICDMSGKVIFSDKIDFTKSVGKVTIDLSNFSSGLYILSIQNEQNIISKKLTVIK